MDLLKKKQNFTEEINRSRNWINEADLIVIGIGGGLSASGGIDYNNPHLAKEHFPDYYRMGYKKLIELYELYRIITDENARAYWGYWGRYIKSIGYDTAVGNGYKDLLRLIRNKNYLIYTTNYDAQVQRTGFEEEKIIALKGDCRFLKCNQGCCEKTYESHDLLETMIKSMSGNLEVSGNKVPRCPHCGGYLVPNLQGRSNVNVDKFINSEQTDKNINQVDEFENRINHEVSSIGGIPRIIFLELGVGTSKIDLIRAPFEHFVEQHQNTQLVRINKYEADVPEELAGKALSIQADLEEVIAELASGVVS